METNELSDVFVWMVTDFHSMGVCGAWPPDFHP
jgi:hypothetical protein